MTLRYYSDPTAASWLVRSGTPPMQLISFGPAGYESYARLRFIPDPTGPGQDEGDIELPEDHPADIAQARRALHLLARFTATPEDCFFCLWDGYSDVTLPPEAMRDSLVDLPYRRYVLLRGPVNGIDSWEADFGGGTPIAPPAFVWPADRRWCFTSDVDPHWAGIGAARAAIDALVDDSELDVVPARPEEPQPSYY